MGDRSIRGAFARSWVLRKDFLESPFPIIDRLEVPNRVALIDNARFAEEVELRAFEYDVGVFPVAFGQWPIGMWDFWKNENEVSCF